MNILALERKYQNSISTDYESFQDFESREYVKENLADILIRGERINDFIPKELIQKKRKRLRRGI
ncbi:hypothetical protein [Flavobacterium crocinum]|uniref:hypothetical protein n=1 Tax=Flavobacterium crocinum TaxID=2183896 RepID=UPI001F0BB077|nr:hypothetical protein [Flavobacterium crocinum]